MSKLYTEEQLKEFFKEHYFITEEDLKNFTPIQLPTDEEIKQEADSYHGLESYNTTFVQGAKWMRDKIGGKDE